MAQGFPLILDLTAVRALVLGQGGEADTKSALLAAAGAIVERRHQYTPGTLSGFHLIVAALPDRSQNAAIFAEAESLSIPVNCVDDPPHCRFFFPSIVRRGDLLLAISTSGACPALAVRLRQKLDCDFGPEYAHFLQFARSLRQSLAAAVPDFNRRKAIWYAIVDAFMRDRKM